ncbi:hypothetical protein FOPG_01428 [Fusarium oxysporum f. sp. conglutinans race 2 54008]|uniref:F-box domain-containing protein n=1 Tax=Fusarium oxysporum f. sp. conglutinans race 2 54008 TaxID=1089457 RepID=X0JSH2_FUSOX|nr:hypothetical protein FOPG_01428 [Fusarium oxysporum f. sp. conglutinans race 2 54008]KAI8419387.1 hypothetical protein FOFC_01969 [Fusarium oxysporum]
MISARALDHLRQHFCGEAVRISDDNNTKAPPTSDGKEDNQKETVSRLIHKPVKDDNSSIAVNVENELLRLPAELQLMILQHLTFGEVESLRRTCRLLRHTINKPFIREVFPSIKFELLSTCYHCLRYDALRDHLIHADESDARYPLANECLDCVSSRGGFVVGQMGILGLWIPPLTGVVRTMEKRSEGVRAADIATIFFIACNILFRFINALGNTLLVSEYKLWRRYMPNQSRPSRILNKVIAFLIFWTYPPSIEQKFPGKWWFSRQNTQA